MGYFSQTKISELSMELIEYTHDGQWSGQPLGSSLLGRVHTLFPRTHLENLRS